MSPHKLSPQKAASRFVVGAGETHTTHGTGASLAKIVGNKLVPMEEVIKGSITSDEGAGHEFHGNQHTGGKGGAPRVGLSEGSPSPAVQNYLKDQRPKLEKAVKEELAHQNYPVSKVTISDKELSMNVAGYAMTPAAMCNFDSGNITIYAPVASFSSGPKIRAIVAHEVGHAIYTSTPYKHFNPVLDRAKHEQLMKDDGCTPYSKKYWKAAAKGKCSAALAVNETFAEIHALVSTKGEAGLKDVKDSWKALYHDVISKRKV